MSNTRNDNCARAAQQCAALRRRCVADDRDDQLRRSFIRAQRRKQRLVLRSTVAECFTESSSMTWRRAPASGSRGSWRNQEFAACKQGWAWESSFAKR